MTALYKFLPQQKIRLGLPLSLIFFALLFAGCRQREKEIRIQWTNKKATGLVIPTALLPEGYAVEQTHLLQVRLRQSTTPILGEYNLAGNEVAFKPLIPLSPGKQYDVFFKEKLTGSLTVPLPDATAAPTVVALYPSSDTLPENLLKIYLRFSSPMQEGVALQHLHLLNSKGDTIPDIFLNLQPELWSNEGTTLTVWLDPGRIKRNLIPNQRLGNPLVAGGSYSIRVDSAWKNTQGQPLKHSFVKRFVAGERDESSPRITQWHLSLPAARTTQPLQVYFPEPLDYFLLKETVQVFDEKGDVVEASSRVVKGEQCLSVVPAQPWRAGRYRLLAAAYLEDLAGNNFNRLFDRDVKRQQKREDEFVERRFVIENQ